MSLQNPDGKMERATDARNPAGETEELPADSDALTLSATDANARFGEIIGRAISRRRTVVTKHGFRAAAIVPIEDYDRLVRLAG